MVSGENFAVEHNDLLSCFELKRLNGSLADAGEQDIRSSKIGEFLDPLTTNSGTFYLQGICSGRKVD